MRRPWPGRIGRIWGKSDMNRWSRALCRVGLSRLFSGSLLALKVSNLLGQGLELLQDVWQFVHVQHSPEHFLCRLARGAELVGAIGDIVHHPGFGAERRSRSQVQVVCDSDLSG